MKEKKNAKEASGESKNVIERLYSMAVETLSILDLVTDLIILDQLYNGHTLETRWLTVVTCCL